MEVIEGKIKNKREILFSRNSLKKRSKKKELITGFKVNGVSLINENQDHWIVGH